MLAAEVHAPLSHGGAATANTLPGDSHVARVTCDEVHELTSEQSGLLLQVELLFIPALHCRDLRLVLLQ